MDCHPAGGCRAGSGDIPYKIAEQQGPWQLLMAGELFYVKGAYHLFEQVRDEEGHVGYANVPFHVQSKQ
jgi:hypothetical protein